MEPIKIAYILEAATGGTARHIVDILMSIELKKYTPHLIVSTLRDSSFNKSIGLIKSRGITVDIIPMKREISPVNDFLMYRKIINILWKGNFDIVHTHSSKAGILGRYAARKAGVKKIVHTPHVFPFEMINITPLKKKIYLKMEQKAGKLTDKIIAVCENEKEVAIKNNIIPQDKISVIYNGIEPDEWQTETDVNNLRQKLGIEENETVIGSIGRLTRQKGYLLLIQAAKHLIESGKKCRFLVVGSGELKNELQYKIDCMDLSSKFHLVAQTDEVLSYMKLFDIFVLPSIWEAFPYVILEAMASGTPVIATSVGGIPEMISDHNTGLLIPSSNFSKIESAIAELTDNRNLYSELSENALRKVKKSFSKSIMISELKTLYSDLF